MPEPSRLPSPHVAIVDYGMGNLFSVQQACASVGLRAAITTSRSDVLGADAVILPGVGAFDNAMETLERLDLVSALRDVAQAGKPFLGICLGMQLLMAESHEFGRHKGLGIVEGDVVRLEVSRDGQRTLKVPQVGWNRVYSTASGESGTAWREPLFQGLDDGEYMYFVHSFYPRPVDGRVEVSITSYGDIRLCSSLRVGSVFACQFHPERSGTAGLRMYQNLARMLPRMLH